MFAENEMDSAGPQSIDKRQDLAAWHAERVPTARLIKSAG